MFWEPQNASLHHEGGEILLPTVAESECTLQQGCHKMTGTQDYDAEVVAWPAKGVTISESGFAPSGMWTCQFYNGLKPTSDTTVTVRCLNSGAVWKIDPANLLDSQAYQVNGTLISYADNSIAFKVGGVYEITYEHLNDRDGKDASYTYRTVYEKAYLSSDGKEEPQQILFDKDSMELTPGSTEKLTAIIHPEDARNKRIYFTSTNPAVATVNECGEITAHAAGTAVITAVSEAGNIKANCKVTVVQKKAETITGKDDEKTPDRKPDTQSSIKLGKASIKSAKKRKASPTVTITLARKVSKASGYQIKVYPTSGKAKKNKGAITTKYITKNTKKLVVKNKKLKNKKGCYVRIRAYQKINGTKKFGAWSAVRKVKNR